MGDIYQVNGSLAEQAPPVLPLAEDAPPPRAPAGRRSLLQRAVEISISLAFLALALRGVEFGVLWAELSHANYLWLAPAILITVVLLFVKGWRWQLLFYPEYRLRFAPVFSALCAGYLVSNVFPARLGEVARLVLLVGEEPVSVARTLSTIIIERVLDVLTLLMMLVLLLPFLTIELPPEVMRSAQVGLVLVLIGAVLVVLLSPRKRLLLGWAHTVLGRIAFLDRPGLYSALEHLVDGFAALRSRLGLLLIGQSFLGWLMVVFMAWASAQAVQLAAPVTALALCVVVTTLGMLLPSTPGYLGVFEYLVTVTLLPFGVSREVAFGFALVWHIVNYLTLCAAGALALWVHGMSFGRVVEAMRRRQSGTAAG